MTNLAETGLGGRQLARTTVSPERNLGEPLLAIDVLDRHRARAIGDEVRSMIDDATVRTRPRDFARTVYKRLGDLPAIERIELPGVIAVRVTSLAELAGADIEPCRVFDVDRYDLHEPTPRDFRDLLVALWEHRQKTRGDTANTDAMEDEEFDAFYDSFPPDALDAACDLADAANDRWRKAQREVAESMASVLREFYEPARPQKSGVAEPALPESPIQQPDAAKKIVFQPRQARVKTYTVKNAADLLRQKFDPIRWAIRGLLPEGVTILAGAPKIGKSWVTFQAGVSVAAGLPLWDGREPETRGGVLLLALEDNDRRMQSRLGKVLDGKGRIVPDGAEFRIDRPDMGRRMDYTNDWPRVNEGGAEKIDEYLEQNPETRLVVVDTLAKFRSVDPGRKSAYDHDYEVGAALKPIADKHKVAILLVHHTRKMGSDDALDAVSGTQGLNGSVDATIVLRRGRGKSEGEMFITGRDIEAEETTALRFDKDSCLWSSLGPAEEVNRSDARREILDHLKQAGAASPKDIAAAIGKNANTTRVLLRKMAVNGDVNSVDGSYSLPGG